ncbi:hypothetical protein Bca52824_024231 [Brassica carinata]|uniref:Uncharacterized protein n=1 Tax=Brassica carinata TaxID=52824 RepID=A0A8X7VJR7_BRACI|nr:hypothetical protein Bca52824_024231 [Brassica carinata]
METYLKRNNKLIPLVFLLIHSVAILIFSRGFLLTRKSFLSTAHVPTLHNPLASLPHPRITTLDSNQNQNQNQTKCWTKPVVDRVVVIIVLDALRIDFLALSAFFPEANESSAKIFKALADPPTTSLQRLKGLTTGGFPTFVDVGNRSHSCVP